MLTKYLAKSGGHPKIIKIEIVKETAQSVFLKGGIRAVKNSKYEAYFDTWEAAHASMFPEYERRLLACRRHLEVENSLLGALKGMKKPTEGATC